MRKILIPLFLFVSTILISQEKNSFIALQSGVSIPVGNYAATNLDYGCFTTVGINANIEGAWFFLPYLGVGAQVGINIHPVDVRSLGWEKVLSDPFLQDVTVRSDSYRMITAAAGLYGKFGIWKHLSLSAKVLGGVMFAKSPYQLYKPEYFLVEGKWFEITSSTDRNLALIAGLGVRYDISRCIGLKIDADYAYSKMVFGFTTATGKRYEYRDISYITTTLGLVIIL